jgi:tetratricopeptide (TPR) repeat protein
MISFHLSGAGLMGRSRVSGTRTATSFLAVISLFILLAAQKQVWGQAPDSSAALQGTVRDSSGHPIPDTTLFLQVNIGAQPLIARTGSSGTYGFLALREGVYTVRAEKEGFSPTTVGPWVLGAKESKIIDLKLEALKASTQTISSPPTQKAEAGNTGKPEFFDQPAFTVAGVTDSTNLGGHGSNVVARNKEALAKETVSLSREAPANSERNSSPSAAREKSLHELVEREPENFTANHEFGKILLARGKSGEALPYLERATQLNPSDYDSAYSLARAYADAGKSDNARSNIRILLAKPGKPASEEAALHHLLADVEEKQGNALEAVREYQRAAELDPSEAHLFDWGAELLMHHAAEPAIEIFSQGNHRFPRSARMLVGLGVALYARGAYEQAAQRLCEASDLNPAAPDPYLFIGKMQSAGSVQSDCLAERLQRFARLQPDNALANYYYALSLLKQRKQPDDGQTLAQVEALLKKSVRLDPKLGTGYLQLGILYSDQKDFPQSISAYQEAIAASPELEEAHYRLSQVYRRRGDKLKAQQELQLYEQMSNKTEEEHERRRHDIQQFVYTLRDQGSVSPPRE